MHHAMDMHPNFNFVNAPLASSSDPTAPPSPPPQCFPGLAWSPSGWSPSPPTKRWQCTRRIHQQLWFINQKRVEPHLDVFDLSVIVPHLLFSEKSCPEMFSSLNLLLNLFSSGSMNISGWRMLQRHGKTHFITCIQWGDLIQSNDVQFVSDDELYKRFSSA